MPRPTDCVRLELYIQPRAAKSEWAGMHDGSLKLRIAAAPADNAANRAVIEFLAESLGVAKGRVRLIKGASSRKKTLEIEGLSAAAVRAALRQP
jgi:uncharacterized protein (TIGR00251 family)